MDAVTRSNSLRANTLSQIAPLASGYLLNIVATPLIVHKLGVQQFGVWALTGAVAQYGGLLDFGISRSVTRFISLHHTLGDSRAESASRAVALSFLGLLATLLLLLSFPAALLVQQAATYLSFSQVFTVVLSSVSILSFTLFARAVAAFSFGRQRMVAANTALAACTTLTVGAGIVALLFSSSLETFALGNAGGALAGLIITVGVVYRTEGEMKLSRPARSEAVEMLRFGVKGQAASVSDLLVLQLPKLVLGFTIGPVAVGLYEIASRLAMGARALGVVLVMSLTPYFTAAYATGGISSARARFLEKSSVYTFVALFPVGAVGCMSGAVVLAWAGSAAAAGAPIALALCIAFIVNLSTGTQTIVANAIGKPGIVARPSLAAALASAAAVFPATLWLGVDGALASVLIAMAVGAIFETLLVTKALGLTPSEVYRSILRPMVTAAILLCAVAPPIFSFSSQSRLQNAALSATALVAFSVVYCAVAALYVKRESANACAAKYPRPSYEAGDTAL